MKRLYRSRQSCIIAGVCGTLAQHGVNVLEISQTIMEGCFTMMMVVDLAGCQSSFEQLRTDITAYSEARDLSLRIQREDIFDAMHKL